MIRRLEFHNCFKQFVCHCLWNLGFVPHLNILYGISSATRQMVLMVEKKTNSHIMGGFGCSWRNPLEFRTMQLICISF